MQIASQLKLYSSAAACALYMLKNLNIFAIFKNLISFNPGSAVKFKDVLHYVQVGLWFIH